MTTAIFTNLGGNIGSNIVRGIGLKSIPLLGSNPLSSFITSKTRGFGSFIGEQVSGKIFGIETINKIKGPRLNDLTIQTSTYGDIIPIIFGRAKIAGNIIWSRPVQETAVTTNVSGGGKGGFTTPVKRTETSFSYKVTFAIALCEGEIANIERMWADNDPINLGDYCTSYSLYKGDETQLPDPIIESFEGIGKTPAYRGMAYIVFEDFDLNSFGNRIPNLNFEVNRPIKGSFNGQVSVEELVTGINLIPGSGEFVYDTIIQKKIYGVEVNDTFIQRGGSDIINMNNSSKKADIVVSIDQLQSTFPNLEWVSIVCTWFADSLDAAEATVSPRVEYKLSTTTQPDLWSVGTYTRDSATQVTLDGNNSPIYGGTPSDQSILRLIDELKSRGYKIMFYPMVFIDNEEKPWRGRMTADAAYIPNFFTKPEGYNDFILHYANLTKDKVDAFVIGSEMKGLTQVNDISNNFPAVDEFVALAAGVKTIMRSSTKITYAGDWSEYHSVNGWYNMDPLWASDNIDFIGIDAYFPLTNRAQDGVYDLQEAMDGWTGGEGYDWYYSDEERTIQASLSAPAAWKNIEWWWSHTHTNPNSVQTDWVPESKKIWFTEFGFPSVDGATNQPNVFYNPESSESALPYYSEGLNDLTSQRLGIEATLLKWQNSGMIEEKLLWTWDARPYPFWPDLTDVWGDGPVWSKGHWVNGKLGSASLAGIISELCLRSNLSLEDIDVGGLQKTVDGYVLNSRVTANRAIEKLSEAFFFNGVESDGIIKFNLKGKEDEIDIAQAELVMNAGDLITVNYMPETYLPTKLDVNFISRENNYNISTTSDFRDSRSEKQLYEANFPLVITSGKAKNIAEISLAESWAERKSYSFSLPYNFVKLDIGDVIKLELGDGLETIKINKITFRQNIMDVEGRSFEGSVYGLLDADDLTGGRPTTIAALIETRFEILDINSIAGDENDKAYLRFAVSGGNENWAGAQIFYSSTENDYQSLGVIRTPSVMGNVINQITDANSFITDEGNEAEIYILNGNLQSVTGENLLNGSNLALIGDEIIQFREAEFVETGRYKLKGLLRGRFGTENKTGTHEAGERFVLLNGFVLRIEMPKSLIGSDLKFKIVSFGQNINDVAPVTITYKARNLVPYAPAHFKTVKDITTGDIAFSWVRRSREFSAWRDFIDVPLAENTEAYNLAIFDDADQIVREINLSAVNYNYTDAQQVEDFGSTQNIIKARVYQLSANIGVGGNTQKTFNF